MEISGIIVGQILVGILGDWSVGSFLTKEAKAHDDLGLVADGV